MSDSIEVVCPECHQPISLEDIQPAANLAICRSCNLTHRLSGIVAGSELDDVSLDQKPRRLTIQNEMDGLRIVYKHIPGMFWFMLPFTCVWSGGSMWGIYLEPIFVDGKTLETSTLLMGLPFVMGSIVLIGVLLCMSCGQRVVRIRSTDPREGECTYFYGVGSIGFTKRIAYRSETDVLLECGGCSVNHRPVEDIVIRNDAGKDEKQEIRFGAFMPDKAKHYLAALIRTTIRS